MTKVIRVSTKLLCHPITMTNASLLGYGYEDCIKNNVDLSIGTLPSPYWGRAEEIAVLYEKEGRTFSFTTEKHHLLIEACLRGVPNA